MRKTKYRKAKRVYDAPTI